MTTRRQRRLVGGVVDEARGLQLLGDQREVLRRDRQVERVVAHRAALDVELLDGLAQPVGTPRRRRTRPGRSGCPAAAASTRPRGTRCARTACTASCTTFAKSWSSQSRRAKPTSAKPGRQQPAVGEVVDRGHELLAGEVAGHAEDDEARRAGDAVEAVVLGRAQRVVLRARSLPEPCGSSSGSADGFEQRAIFAAGSVSVRVRTGRPCVGEHARVAGRLRRDELAERERTVGDLEVDAGASRICRNTPTAGPPLWNWPVECRKRGPQPNVTGRPARAASRSRRRASSGWATRST